MKVLLGYTRKWEKVYHYFSIPHLLIAGMSGYGKTDLIRLIMYQLLRWYGNMVRFWVVDMKKASFIPFMDIPQIERVGTNLGEAYCILQDAADELDRRTEMVLKARNRDLFAHYPKLFVIIDEASLLAAKHQEGKEEIEAAKSIYKWASAISCVGREPGMGLIFATQYPTREVIYGQIKANMEAVVAFHVENGTHSKVALDSPGAEDITVKGRAIYKCRGSKRIIQVPFVGKDEVWEQKLAGMKVSYYDPTTEGYADYVDVEGASYSDNAADCASLSRVRFASQKSIGDTQTHGKRRTGRRQISGARESEGMETFKNRPGKDGYR